MSQTPPLPWERQPGETARAFGAFCAYRDLGPRRGLRAAAQAFYGRASAAAVPQLATWSAAARWVGRAAAWDDEQDRLARDAQAQARREMAERHAKEAMMLQQKALQRLQALDPALLGAGDVLRYFVEAAKLERLARGEPDAVQRHELTGRGGGPVRFSLEDAVAAARELEEDDRDGLQRGGGAALPPGGAQVP